MNKFYFIGGLFLAFGGLLPLVALWNLASFFSLKHRGRVEQRVAHAAISRGSDSGRQVRLQVELQDELGETVMLESRTTNKDWVVYEGEPVTVIYDPGNPLGGWIEHDFRNRLRLVVILTPLFLAIGGVVMAIGFFS
ncbi:MAG: DUF3592 domain-containing protein [Pseudomonadota bacterium]